VPNLIVTTQEYGLIMRKNQVVIEVETINPSAYRPGVEMSLSPFTPFAENDEQMIVKIKGVDVLEETGKGESMMTRLLVVFTIKD
jgi:hypothetical protein